MIRIAFQEFGHTVVIWNIKQRITKKQLSIFGVELQPKANNKQIYNIKNSLHLLLEPLRLRREIS